MIHVHLAEKSLLASTNTLGAAAKERVTGLLRGLMIVIIHHKVPLHVLNSALAQFVVFLDVEQESVFLKRSKYLLAMPMSRYLRNPEPETPDRIAFHGPWKRWAKSRLIAYNRRNTHLWMSFMQCKRSALPLSPGIVYETYQKHRVQMTRSDPLEGQDAVFLRALRVLKPIIAKIKAKLARVLDRELQSLDHKASQNASWESSRSSGGQTSTLAIRLYAGAFGPDVVPSDGLKSESEDLVSMEWSSLSASSARKRTAGRGGVTVDVPTVATNTISVQRTDLMLQEHWRVNMRKWAIDDVRSYNGRLPAMIQAVLEPLKVRVISKGPSAPYYYSKGLQQALHTIMRKMPCFRLIGRPVSPTDLYDLDRGTEASLWFSGDYEASTDNLSARLGNGIFAELIDELDDEDIEVYKAVLAPHRCHYPPVKGYDDIEPVDQRNGQLMGSVLSFPILCLANLALYLMSVLPEETSDDDIRSACDKVLVNGDDILYRATPAEVAKHEALGVVVGLKMSVGKTYAHKEYANINSTSFDYKMSSGNLFGSGTGSPWQIDFLNTGLYYGQHKVLGRVGVDIGDEEIAPSPICGVINYLIQGSLPGRQGEILAQYMTQHADAIREETHGRNLFIAKSLGGMGVSLPAGFQTNFTWLQRKIAKLYYLATSDKQVKISPYLFRVLRRPVVTGKAWTLTMMDPILYRDPAKFSSQQANLAETLKSSRDLDLATMQLGIVLVTPFPHRRPDMNMVMSQSMFN